MEKCSMVHCKLEKGQGDFLFCKTHRTFWIRTLELLGLNTLEFKEEDLEAFYQWFIKNEALKIDQS